MNIKYLATITSCALGITAYSAFSNSLDPAIIIHNINTKPANATAILVEDQISQYQKFPLLNNQGQDRTTIFYPSNDNNKVTKALEDAQYPSVVGGIMDNAHQLLQGFTVYITNNEDQTYCGFDFFINPFTSKPEVASASAGKGIVGNYTLSCPQGPQSGNYLPGINKNGFALTTTTDSIGRTVYNLYFCGTH